MHCSLRSSLYNNNVAYVVQSYIRTYVYRAYRNHAMPVLYLTQCRINVGAIDAAALGPFKK